MRGQAELDMLMKFLFRGMSEPDEERCKALLSWHAAVRRPVSTRIDGNLLANSGLGDRLWLPVAWGPLFAP